LAHLDALALGVGHATERGVRVDRLRLGSTKRESQDRKTGEAILRFKDTKGSLVAVRLRPGQFRTLANGVLGLAEARRGR